MASISRRDFRFYVDLYRSYVRSIAAIVGLYLVKHGAWMVFPMVIKFIIDDFIPHRNTTAIFCCIPIVFGLGLINLVCHAPFRMITTALIKSVSRDLRNQIIGKLQILSISLVNKSETGRYYSKIMQDVTKTENFANTVFVQIIGAIFTFIYATVFLVMVSWKMFLCFLLIVPVYVVVYRLFAARFQRYQHEARMADEDLSQAVNQFIQTSTLTRIHGEEDFEQQKVDRKGENIVKRYRKISGSIGIFSICIASTGQIFQISIVAGSALAVMRGVMTIGGLVIFYQYIQQMCNAIIAIMDVFPTLVESAESVRSIQEILNQPDIEENESKPSVQQVAGRIDFNNVTFEYVPGKPALADVSASIAPGTTVALVGPSGSGKTTFVNMALGMLRTKNGTVSIDGRDVGSIDMRSVRKCVGVVTQQPILFHGTVTENIAHARTNASLAEIQEAARKANAHEFITAMEKGYDTMIGEQGATLSGGQKQRIAIARAILRRPSILILDEATSALDSFSEKEVQQGIDAMLGNQTTLTIAHRLSTIADADTILVFREGRIVEQGTHAQLVDQGGLYAALYRAQAMERAEQPA